MQKVTTEWYDFPNVKFTKMLSFLFGSRGLRPDLPSLFGGNSCFACLVHPLMIKYNEAKVSDQVAAAHGDQ